MDSELSAWSIKVSNYKCFGPAPQGFEKIKGKNIIVGRNNSGKSTLLDVIEMCIDGRVLPGRRDASTIVHFSAPLKEGVLRTFLSNEWHLGYPLVGSRISWSTTSFKSISFGGIESRAADKLQTSRKDQIAVGMGYPLQGKRFRKISAHRNIEEEKEETHKSIGADGRFVTNELRRYVTIENLPAKLVEREMLAALNKICQPDSAFARINVKVNDSGQWRILLDEEGKGTIAIGDSGSGIRTVLLVLANLLLVPNQEKVPLSQYVFAFEELENSLHPAMQRRLMAYISEMQRQHGFVVFLTTHSNVIIDFFSRDEDAQIVHVTHDQINATVLPVTTYDSSRKVLDDLDVRASDLLQANGIVWVEGPTDRHYVNQWIELWSEKSLREGIHYQCLTYGGKLISHFSSVEPTADQVTESINMMRVNRNAAILIDRDRDSSEEPLKPAAQRLCAEFEASRNMAWVTDGREIENYIPPDVLARVAPEFQTDEVDPYRPIAEQLANAGSPWGSDFGRKKVEFASAVCPLMRKEHIEANLALAEKMRRLCNEIRRWNNMGQI